MQFDQTLVRNYIVITSGVLGRLVIALIYFLIIANVLPLADFGRFAAASAVGLVLSRLLAFGFISAVYRGAAAKPRLLGSLWAGLLGLTVVSLPLITLLAFAIHWRFLADAMSLAVFAAIVSAEILGWRVTEWIVITLNGLGRFGRAATLVVLGSAVRTLAAIGFLMAAGQGLESWSHWYLAANALTLLIAIAVFAPQLRLRWRWRIYPSRLRDAVTSAGAELFFYAQGELDKLLVLAISGDRNAGLYAIAMRIIDLTATPVRSFNQLYVQRRIAAGREAMGRKTALLIEFGIAIVSTVALFAVIALLWLQPMALGRNVAAVAPLLPLLLAVPALRNLAEYHGERLYAADLGGRRLLLLIVLMAVKFGLMAVFILPGQDIATWAPALNGVSLVVYLVSLALVFITFRSSGVTIVAGSRPRKSP